MAELHGRPLPVELPERELKRLFIAGATAADAAKIADTVRHNHRTAREWRQRRRKLGM